MGSFGRCSSPPLCLGSGSRSSRRLLGRSDSTAWQNSQLCGAARVRSGGTSTGARKASAWSESSVRTCSNFVIRKVEVPPNGKIGGREFVLIHVGRRVCFSTRESVVQLNALLCVFPENTVAFPHSLEHAVAELFLTL